jgi:hypothetical protein
VGGRCTHLVVRHLGHKLTLPSWARSCLGRGSGFVKGLGGLGEGVGDGLVPVHVGAAGLFVRKGSGKIRVS